MFIAIIVSIIVQVIGYYFITRRFEKKIEYYEKETEDMCEEIDRIRKLYADAYKTNKKLQKAQNKPLLFDIYEYVEDNQQHLREIDYKNILDIIAKSY